MREVRGYRVTGMVQGVGFRWWTTREAARLGVFGSVRNHEDGSVVVVAAASGEVLDEFEETLGRGPALAMVARVDRFTPAFPPEGGAFVVER
jgi:acylphosphatase